MEKKIIARNKRASHDYFILDTIECGIVLTGTEIKSIRMGKVSIQEAYCQIKNNQMIIFNMDISKYHLGTLFNHQEKRDRILLMHKKEIRKYGQKVQLEGLTIIPTLLYFKEGLVKVEIALCKGKKNYDKREDLKREAMNNDKKKALKNY